MTILTGRKKLEDKIYSILYDHSCLSDGNIGVRVAYEDEWPIKELANLLASHQSSLVERVREKIEGGTPRYIKGGALRTQYYAKGYNDFRDDVLSLLKKEVA